MEVTRGHRSRRRSRQLMFYATVMLIQLMTLIAQEVDGAQNQQQRQPPHPPQQQHGSTLPPTTASGTRPPTKRRVAKVEGDIILGALFPVHRQPSINTSFTRQCGEVCMITMIDCWTSSRRRLFHVFLTVRCGFSWPVRARHHVFLLASPSLLVTRVIVINRNHCFRHRLTCHISSFAIEKHFHICIIFHKVWKVLHACNDIYESLAYLIMVTIFISYWNFQVIYNN